MKQKKSFKTMAYRFKRFARKSYSAFNSMHRVVNFGVVTACMLTFAGVKPTSAQSSTSNDVQQSSTMEKELEEVMVTATRVESPINQTARVVTVITKREIEQAPVQSIQDLLVYAANVDVVQRGAHGVQADISLRGGTSDQTAVLLNGVNLSNSHTGHYNFDIPINLSDIERIEIISGPSSLIYGASAFSGGINIITKKNIDNRLFLRAGGGMHNLYEGEARGALQTGIVTNSLSFGYNTSGGYADNSEYDIYNALLQTHLSLSNKNKIDVQLGYNNKRYGANTFYSALYPNQFEKTETYLSSAKGIFNINNLKITPIVYWTRHNDQFDLTKGSEKGRHYHRNDMYGGNLNFTYTSHFGITTLGGELRREEILSSKLGNPVSNYHGKHYIKYDSRTTSSLALEHNVSIEKFVLSAGILLNHNTLDNSTRFFPSASASYHPTGNVKIYTTWSKGTRMPTFTDLYYTTETHTSNSGLKPERSESWEIGMNYRNRIFSAHITGFLQWGRNMIDWVKEKPQDNWQSWNLTKIDQQGIEIGTKLYLEELIPFMGKDAIISVDYVRLHQNKNNSELISKYALNYLQDKLTAQLYHRIWKDLTANWQFRFQNRMGTYTSYKNIKTGEQKPFHAYSTLDVKINYKYKSFNFNINMTNLYDTDYNDLGTVPQPGFWLIGGVSYTIK